MTSAPTFNASFMAAVDAVADKLLSTFITNLGSERAHDGNPWLPSASHADHQLEVVYSVANNTKVHRFKAQFELPGAEPRTVFELTQDDAFRSEWDRNLERCEHTTLRDDGEHDKLYLSHAFSKNYGPVSGRDFLDVSQTSALPDGSFVKAWHSLDASACTAQFPPVAGYVRGFQHLGGWHFAPNATRTGTTVIFIVHTDMRGWLSSFVLNNTVGGSFVGFAADLSGALAQWPRK